MQSNGQTSTQTPHPLQLSGWTTAMGRSWRFKTLVTLPHVSRIASSGQITPHAPQSMQSVASMKKAFFGSPLIAPVGQRFSHAVQPVQFSATMVNGTLLLHLLQDLVRPPLFDEPVVPERLPEPEPGEEQHQDHHPRDRDVVGLEEDVEELAERGHGPSRTAPASMCQTRRIRAGGACVAAVLRAKSRGIQRRSLR